MRVRAAAVALLLLAACGGDTKAQTYGPRETTPTTVVASTGRQTAKITTFDRAARTVTYDVVQLLTGEKARTAFKKDKGEELDGDYYLRNQTTQVRTAPIADDAVFRVNALAGNGSTDITVDYDTFARYLDSEPASAAYFELAFNAGEVVAVNEIYLP